MAEPLLGSGRGHGKLILSGEHAVVYGFPALGMGLTAGTTVSLHPTVGATHFADPSLTDPRLAAVLAALLPTHGVQVVLSSDLPLGCGMGSSAALAVGLVRADAQRRGETLSRDQVWEAALAIERFFHGTPSGLDHALADRGGVLRFIRAPEPVITALPTPRWSVVVYNTGKPGNTAQMVAGVAAGRPANLSTLQAIGDLTEDVAAALGDLDTVGPLLTENHRLLQQLGVSTPDLDALVAHALKAGAHGAKLSGAGGGGVVLAATQEPARLLDAARRSGVPALACQVAEGS